MYAGGGGIKPRNCMKQQKELRRLLPVQEESFHLFPFLNRKRAAFIVAVLSLAFYAPSLFNEYALDDGIIIHQNDHVLKGVRGIGGIIGRDAYESFYRRMCATDQLAGGRYRPLSVVTFALEQELLGTYRTGLYMKVEDSNRNGVLDNGLVGYVSPCGRQETNYEYNEAVDVNGDGMIQGTECNVCWDRNHNMKNDREEDLNSDGLFNEVDCQLYGATFRHFNNIWMYALGCVLLYTVFSTCLFRTSQDLAFIAALLFALHPIHSEAVANVKSRDEIVSLIFISLTFLFSFRFIDRGDRRSLVAVAVSYLLALLSKEYAVMLLLLLPAAFYCFTGNRFSLESFRQSTLWKPSVWIALLFAACAFLMLYVKRDYDIHALPGARPLRSYWFFPVLFFAFILIIRSRDRVFTLMKWLGLVMLIYLGMRLNAVRLKPGVPDTEILNNPYLLATGEERFCTKVFVLLKYLLLQVFPHPLSSDYSYDSITYRHFTSWDFILSLALHIAMAIGAVVLLVRKHVLGFALLTYILFELMIGNILMDIGATMGERLIFHSSIGFCIGIAWLIEKLFTGFKIGLMRQVALYGCMSLIVFLYGCKTWERDFDWKNDITLFLKDVKTHPNSVLCLGNAGARYVDLLNTNDFTRQKLADYDTVFNDQNGTLRDLVDEVHAGKYGSVREAAIHHGIDVLTHAIGLHPRYVNGYLNLGLLHFQLHNDFEALYYWKNAERLYPNNPYLRSYYMAYESDLKNRAAMAIQRNRWDSAAIAYNLVTILTPANHESWYNLGGAYFNCRRFNDAANAWRRALALKSDYKEAIAGLRLLNGSVPVSP